MACGKAIIVLYPNPGVMYSEIYDSPVYAFCLSFLVKEGTVPALALTHRRRDYGAPVLGCQGWIVDIANDVKLFATVPYPQHYYDTGCLNEESWGMDRVTDYGS